MKTIERLSALDTEQREQVKEIYRMLWTASLKTAPHDLGRYDDVRDEFGSVRMHKVADAYRALKDGIVDENGAAIGDWYSALSEVAQEFGQEAGE